MEPFSGGSNLDNLANRKAGNERTGQTEKVSWFEWRFE